MIYLGYEGRGDLIRDFLLQTGESELLLINGVPNGFDGRVYVYKSGDDFYITVVPASVGLDYAAWAVFGVHAVATSQSNCWGNTLWTSYNLDIFDRIMAVVRPLLRPASRVQFHGLSQGGAQSQLLARAFAVQGNPQQVDAIGFGAPRGIADGAPVLSTVRYRRFVNQLDPVDLLPPQTMLTPDGGPLPGLPVPNEWGNVGTRYQWDASGALDAVPDHPWPGDATFLALLPNFIINHTPSAYTEIVMSYFGLASGRPGGVGDAGNWINLANIVMTGAPILPTVAVQAAIAALATASAAPGTPPLIVPPAVQGLSTEGYTSSGGDFVLFPAVQGVSYPNFITPFGRPRSGGSSVPANIGVDPH
jgi:hypothetical protein